MKELGNKANILHFYTDSFHSPLNVAVFTYTCRLVAFIKAINYLEVGFVARKIAANYVDFAVLDYNLKKA
jgi:hypothetical protein